MSDLKDATLAVQLTCPHAGGIVYARLVANQILELEAAITDEADLLYLGRAIEKYVKIKYKDISNRLEVQ